MEVDEDILPIPTFESVEVMETTCPSCKCSVQLLVNKKAPYGTIEGVTLVYEPEPKPINFQEVHHDMEAKDMLQHDLVRNEYSCSKPPPMSIQYYHGKKAPSGKERFRWVGNAELNEKFERAIEICSNNYTRIQDGTLLPPICKLIHHK
jgi:hypothetical protein